MAVKITIHRGTDQIGGSITEIATEKAHIFIDFGAELSPDEGKSTDDKMVEMMKKAKCDAVLFTHYHGDHVGLLDKLPEKDADEKPIRLGIGSAARNVMKNIHKSLIKFYSSIEPDTEKKKVHEKVCEILNTENRWINFADRTPFKIGDFTVTPVKTDHSAFDSYMFIIEAEGKTIVHTGDFRTHGRRGKDFFDEKKGLPAVIKCLEHKPDVLLIEGTMLSRLKLGEKDSEVISEDNLKEKATELLKNHTHVFVVCSSTNVDSLASFHNALTDVNNNTPNMPERKLYVGSYVMKQLKTYNKAESDLFDMKQIEYANEKNIEKMVNDGFVMIINNPASYFDFVNKFDFEKIKPILIYSMWDGYLKKGKPYTNENYIRFVEMFKEKCYKLHTSGHAYKEDLKKMIRKVDPKEAIIPIHTERKEDFKKLKIYKDKNKNEDILARVAVMNDRETYHVGMDYQGVADEAARLLENTEWKERYGSYIRKIKENEAFVEKVCSCFESDPLLKKYLTVSKVVKASNTVKIDLRVMGHSVGTIRVTPEKSADGDKIRKSARVTFSERGLCKKAAERVNKKMRETFINETSVLYKKQPEGGWQWHDKEVQEVFPDILQKQEFELTSEHSVETTLLDILKETDEKRKEKNLIGIQPCTLCGQYYQLPTPLKGSHAHSNTLKYARQYGKGPDILARINRGSYSELCVIELKDTYEAAEPPAKAIKQAIAYATFIIKLIRTDADWYKYLLDDEKAALPDTAVTVNAVIAMPYKNGYDEPGEEDTAFKGIELRVWRSRDDAVKIPPDIIKLHYLYFKKNEGKKLEKFKTSLFDEEDK